MRRIRDKSLTTNKINYLEGLRVAEEQLHHFVLKLPMSCESQLGELSILFRADNKNFVWGIEDGLKSR